jgi:hypothetical protein
MNSKPTTASPYRRVVKSALVQQVLILILAGMILDGGVTGEICLFAAVGFWGGVALVRFRRPVPTRIDLILIEGSYIVLCVIAFFLTHWIWRLKGVV